MSNMVSNGAPSEYHPDLLTCFLEWSELLFVTFCSVVLTTLFSVLWSASVYWYQFFFRWGGRCWEFNNVCAAGQDFLYNQIQLQWRVSPSYSQKRITFSFVWAKWSVFLLWMLIWKWRNTTVTQSIALFSCFSCAVKRLVKSANW